jgi:uncharacterized protein
VIEHWENIFNDYLCQHFNQQINHDDGHSLGHLQRVWKMAKTIAESEKNKTPDNLVILAACYFHDIVSYPKNDIRRAQSSLDAAKKSKQLLLEMNFPEEKIDQVFHCIHAHSFSANISPETIEAKIVQDADRLEALGAIGLARVFYVAGQMATNLFSGLDPFAQKRKLDDKKYALDHFQTKLLRLPETMKTKGGITEANRRAKILRDYLDHLRLEL